MSSLDLSLITGFETAGADTGTTNGTTITGNASAHTKGVWAQLIASTAAEASWIDVFIADGSAASQQYLVDIGVGAAASETVLIPNLHFESVTANSGAAHYRFPVAIAAGTRLSARCQSNSGGDTLKVVCILGQGDPGSLAAPGSVEAYGADTANTRVTQIDPGAAAHTKSAWTQLTASTGIDVRWINVTLSRAGSSMIADTRYLVDIGIGGSGSEVVVVANIPAWANTAGDYVVPRTSDYAVDIPAGTRIAARLQSSSTSAGDRVLAVGVYGADAADVAGGGGQHAHAGWGG